MCGKVYSLVCNKLMWRNVIGRYEGKCQKPYNIIQL